MHTGASTRARAARLVVLFFGVAVALLGPSHAGAEIAADGPVPVGKSDPRFGKDDAPVTLVLFSDLQCPFCKRLWPTIGELAGQYGPGKLRVVFKHNPLPFHPDARPAAEAAAAVHAVHGAEAFRRFVDKAHELLVPRGQHTTDDALRESGLGDGRVRAELASGKAAAKVDADVELAKALGLRGTPASLVNGVLVSGAQAKEKFVEVIDRELAEAEALRRSGTPAARVWRERTKSNWAEEEKRRAQAPAASPSRPAEDPKAVWKVPVGRSPQRGPTSAPVTLVVFSEFQCPFCSRLVPTLEQLRQHYGDKLRIVFKHNPLPFHTRAEPAAELALEALARRGEAGFWKAHDLLFERQRSLEDADLAQIAAEIGLEPNAAMKAVRDRKHRATIESDQDLADEVQAAGTPHSFVNGRRLAGAHPFEKFREIVDEEIAHAREVRARGIRPERVYEEIIKDGRGAPAPEKTTAPLRAPGVDNPTRGPAGAKVTIHVFTDFECPFCARARDRLDEVDAEFPGKVRWVFHHNPLPFHTNAMAAHRAAAEAQRQKGAAGFWKMHDLLFANQRALDRASLEGYARELGLDLASFRAALDDGRHDKAIEADLEVGKNAGVTGTPAFFINGYVLTGAQPLPRFRKIIRLALGAK
jgi:protein-disulfide isomerase